MYTIQQDAILVNHYFLLFLDFLGIFYDTICSKGGEGSIQATPASEEVLVF